MQHLSLWGVCKKFHSVFTLYAENFPEGKKLFCSLCTIPNFNYYLLPKYGLSFCIKKHSTHTYINEE